MKTYAQHYDEFTAYCRTLTDAQVYNVYQLETKRYVTNPDDECYEACYRAAKDEYFRRVMNENSKI